MEQFYEFTGAYFFLPLTLLFTKRPLVKYYQMSPPVGLVLDALGSAGTASCFYQLAHIIPWISLPLCIFFYYNAALFATILLLI